MPGSFNKIASSRGTSDWTCLSTVSLTSSNRIIYFWGTCLLIALLPLLSSVYPIVLDTSIPTRHSPMPGTCADRTFLLLKLNDFMAERWTERDIFIKFWALARIFLIYRQASVNIMILGYKFSFSKKVCLKHSLFEKKILLDTKILFTTSRMQRSFTSGLNLTKVQLSCFSICFCCCALYPISLSQWSNSSYSIANLYFGKYRSILYFLTPNW